MSMSLLTILGFTLAFATAFAAALGARGARGALGTGAIPMAGTGAGTGAGDGAGDGAGTAAASGAGDGDEGRDLERSRRAAASARDKASGQLGANESRNRVMMASSDIPMNGSDEDAGAAGADDDGSASAVASLSYAASLRAPSKCRRRWPLLGGKSPMWIGRESGSDGSGSRMESPLARLISAALGRGIDMSATNTPGIQAASAQTKCSADDV